MTDVRGSLQGQWVEKASRRVGGSDTEEAVRH